MQIRELYLKHFGKFSDKQIELSAGINVLYGENESGKSTVYEFIRGMLFGMERGRGRAAANDTFSRYEPWENRNYYAGIIRFEVGGKIFRLERSFDKYTKGASLICEEDGEELSLEKGDLEILLDGLDEATFENTIGIGQLKVETNQNLATALRNYAANYYASGNSEIDLGLALHNLQEEKKKLEKKTRAFVAEKQENKKRMEQEASYIWRDLVALKKEYQSIPEEVHNLQGNESLEKKKESINPIFVILPIIGVILSALFLGHPWDYLVGILLVLGDALYVWNHLKERKNQKPEISEIEQKWQSESLKESIKEKQIQYDNVQEQLEELDELDQDFKDQDKRHQAIILATEELMNLSREINQDIGKKMNRRASEILESITGGKYARIIIEENLEMYLLSEGRRIDIFRVSRGTIEQIYFAIRMAAGEILHEEEYPIILDDTFAYYDDKRTENTLRWLSENRGQVLLFTCHNRERQILEKCGIEAVYL